MTDPETERGDPKTEWGTGREITINMAFWRVVIVATGLHLTTSCWGNNTKHWGGGRKGRGVVMRQTGSERQGEMSGHDGTK